MKSLKNIDKKTLIKEISISTGISFLASKNTSNLFGNQIFAEK